MSEHLHQVISYLKHLSRSRSAHGLHSPFLFNLYQEAIRRKSQNYPIYPEQIRKKLLQQNKSIKLEGFGAGSAIDDSRTIQIRHHAVNSLKGINESQLVYRILRYLNPSSVLELGTSFGVSTLYIRAACPNAKITTIEGEIEIQKVAKSFFKEQNITAKCLDLELDLENALKSFNSLDCVIFDANHQLEPTINYFEKCIKKISNDSFFIFDDVYWSKDMSSAWNIIKRDPRVTVSIDLFHFGIVFFRKEQRKESFRLRQFQFLH